MEGISGITKGINRQKNHDVVYKRWTVLHKDDGASCKRWGSGDREGIVEVGGGDHLSHIKWERSHEHI